jgi:hypothetical protein
MATEILEEKNMSHLLKAVANLVKLPKTHMWLDYDSEADVLYLHFEDKPNSTHSPPILHYMLKTATKWVSRTIGKSGFGFYMCKIKVVKCEMMALFSIIKAHD